MGAGLQVVVRLALPSDPEQRPSRAARLWRDALHQGQADHPLEHGRSLTRGPADRLPLEEPYPTADSADWGALRLAPSLLSPTAQDDHVTVWVGLVTSELDIRLAELTRHHPRRSADASLQASQYCGSRSAPGGRGLDFFRRGVSISFRLTARRFSLRGGRARRGGRRWRGSRPCRHIRRVCVAWWCRSWRLGRPG